MAYNGLSITIRWEKAHIIKNIAVVFITFCAIATIMIAGNCKPVAQPPTPTPTPPSSPETPPPSEATPTEPQHVSPQPQSQKINGSFETIRGIPILRIWGTPKEMGYAHGYLCAQQIIDRVTDQTFGAGAKSFYGQAGDFEKMLNRMHRYIQWSQSDVEEMQGILDGMQAALGGELPIFTSSMIANESKVMDLELLSFMNCASDVLFANFQCSGFAIWGNKTIDGKIRVGGNHDIPSPNVPLSRAFPGMLVVRSPKDGLRTVVATYYGDTGYVAGINESGLSMVTQACSTPWINVVKSGFPNAIIKRHVLDSVNAGPDMISEISKVIDASPRIMGQNLLFAQKNPAQSVYKADSMALVFECDSNGFTVRLTANNASRGNTLQDAMISTNHFLLRQIPTTRQPKSWQQYKEHSNNRYQAMLKEISSSNISNLPDMQKILQSTTKYSTSDFSIYLEPDSNMIHIAMRKSNDPSSTLLTPATFSWDELFFSIPE